MAAVPPDEWEYPLHTAVAGCKVFVPPLPRDEGPLKSGGTGLWAETKKRTGIFSLSVLFLQSSPRHWIEQSR
jgi:hypothetical protein